MPRFALFVFAVALITTAASSAVASPPGTMNYQGVLRDSAGAPVVGAVNVRFSIHDAATSGAELWSETLSVTPVGGVFEVVLGTTSGSELAPEDFAAGPLWLELQVGNDVLSPRQELTSAPWALWSARADVALALDDPAPASYQVPLGGIIDWYAFSTSEPVPDGYAVCDGSNVTDALSPYFGQPLPDLVNRFAMGVAAVGSTGTTGGSNTANLSHDHTVSAHTHTVDQHRHDIAHTHTLNNHNHTMHHGHGTASHSHRGDNHRHRWVRWVGGSSERFDTYNGDASEATYSANETMAGNQYTDTGSGTSALAKGSSTASEYFFTSGAYVKDAAQVNQEIGDLPSNTPVGLTGSASPSTDSSSNAPGFTSGNDASLRTGSEVLATNAASTSNSGYAGLTTNNGGAGSTGGGGPSSFDNRPAWVGLLKIMRVR